jgi:WD40 repeat protein
MTAGGALVVWDVNSDALPEVDDCHPWSDIGFWWSPDQTRIAVMAWDSTLVWICNRQFERILSFEGYRMVAWSPDGSEIATVGIENTLRIWDTTYGEAVLTSRGKSIQYNAWSPDGTQIAIGHRDGDLQLLIRATTIYFIPTLHIQVDGLSDVVWAKEALITASNKGIIQFWNIS